MSSFLFRVMIIFHVLELSHCLINFNVTVSKDGTADYFKVADAIASIRAPNTSTRIYIHVKPGIYQEHIEIPNEKTFVSLIGDDASSTVIVDDRSNHRGYSTENSATFIVRANNFMAQSITFENSAGPQNGQAVAFLVEANRTSYYKCVFKGYQDTLYVGGKFHFFKECAIYGSVDFIFGDGLAVFQDCNVYARLWGSTMTAQSKSSAGDRSGFSFQNCSITASPESSKDKVSVSLGRPWRNFATVIILQSFLDIVVEPQGWSGWDTPVNLLFYAEYNNYGPGANTSKRVSWSGYHVLHTEEEASKFTVEIFIDGLQWLPETGIPFRSGLHL